MLKKILLLLITPFLFLDTPYLIYHQHRLYTPILHTYLEKDFGGGNTLKMDYLDIESQNLIKEAWVLKSPFRGLSIDSSSTHALKFPSLSHWLGTIPTGQDTLSYALHALFIQVYTALILTVISYFLGCFVGMLQACSNTFANLFIQLYLEVSRSIPFVMIVILCLQKSILFFLLLFSFTQWTKYAHLARIQTLPLLKKAYIVDAKYQGVATPRLLWVYLFPKVRKGTQALIPHTFLNYFSIITSLHYFDITLFPEHPSLGRLIFYAQQYPDQYQILLPCCLIFFVISILALSIPNKHCQNR